MFHNFTNKPTNKYWSMQNQFYCHLYNPAAGLKPTWNLETGAPNVGLYWTYANLCNPR